MNRAESISIQSDEDGFLLTVRDDLGEIRVFDIQGVVFEFYAEVQKEIRPYVLEAERNRPGTLVDTPQHVLDAGVDAWIDSGYEPDDPKSPGYRERMVD